MSAIRRVAVLGLGSMGRRHLENTVALGREAVGFDPDQALQAWVRESSFVDHGLEDGIDADILHQRLRDLGYLG